MKLVMSPPLIFFVILLWTSSTFCLEQGDELVNDGPPITLVSMKTNSVVISWIKTGDWSDVTDFTVTITEESLDSEVICIKDVTCEEEDPCTFDSASECPKQMDPCTTFEILVEGNGTSSSLQNLISAPNAVTNGTLEFNAGSVSCSWVLPGGSKCHNTTKITIKSPGNEYPKSLAANKTTSTQDLTACDVGDITCSIQALGGTQGVSDRENATGIYSDKDAGSLIADLTLTPSKDSMEVSWTLDLPEGDSCSRLSGYQISWEPDKPEGIYIEDDPTLAYTMGDLIPCTSYNVTLQPMLSESTTLAEPIQKNNNTNIVVLDPPSKPIVNEVGPTWTKVTWAPPKPFGSLCPLESYNVTWRFGSVTVYQSPELPPEQNTYNITDLTPCNAYRIEVLTKNSQGYSQPSPSAIDFTSIVVLDPPSNITVDDEDTSWMQVTWITKEFGTFCVLKSNNVTWTLKNGTEFHSPEIPKEDGNIYNITDLTPCTTLKVQVTSKNNEGYSQPSLPVGLNTSLVVFDPPSDVTVDDAISTWITVSWIPKEFGSLCLLESINVTWSLEDGTESQSEEIPAEEGNVHNITGLTPCTTYEIEVRSKNSVGYSQSSSPIMQNTSIAVPYPPSNVTAEEEDTTSIKVTWVPKLFSSWCPLESNYVTWSLENSTEFHSEEIDTEEGNSYTITDLIPCSTHKVEVTYKNSEGYGQPSDTVYLNTSLIELDPPSDVTVDDVDATSVKVTWTTESFGSLCSLISSNVNWTLENGTYIDSHELPADEGDSYTIPNLIPCTTYNIEVKSNNYVGYSEPLDPVSQNTSLKVLDPPSDVIVAEVNATWMEVTWIPKEFGPWCPLESANVTWTPNDGTEPHYKEISAEDGNIYNITDLTPCTTYTIEVRSKNSQGYSQPSKLVYQDTSLAVPKAPRTVTCVNADTQNISVTWNKPPNNNCAKDYFVNYKGDVLWSEEVKSGNQSTPLEHINLNGLTPWTLYTVCIAGAIEDGSLGSFNCCFIATSQGAPSAPASFNASASSKSVTLTWEKPLELNGLLTGYLLSWGSEHRTVPNDATEYTEDLSPKTDYHFTLKAMTEGGIGEGISVDVTTKTINVLGIVLGVLGGLVVVVALAAVAFIYRQKIINFKTKMTQSRSSASPTTSYPPGKVSAPEGILMKDVGQYHIYEN